MYCRNCGGIFEYGVCVQCNAVQNAYNPQNHPFDQPYLDYNPQATHHNPHTHSNQSGHSNYNNQHANYSQSPNQNQYHNPQPYSSYNQRPNYTQHSTNYNHQHPNQNQGQYHNPQANPYPTGAPAKNKVTAGILALFLGWGIYCFYLGHIKKGVAHLCLHGSSFIVSIIGIVMIAGLNIVGVLLIYIAFVLAFISPVWSFIDALRIFFGKVKDRNGNLLI